jgi:hypothetical protein
MGIGEIPYPSGPDFLLDGIAADRLSIPAQATAGATFWIVGLFGFGERHMIQNFLLRFVWPDGIKPKRSAPHIIQAENRGEAGRVAEAFWRGEPVRPIGFDLLDPVGTPVFHFRDQSRKAA